MLERFILIDLPRLLKLCAIFKAPSGSYLCQESVLLQEKSRSCLLKKAAESTTGVQLILDHG